MLFNSPMEQFLIVPLSSSSFFIHFSNNVIYLILSVFFLCSILLVLSFESGSLKGFVFIKNAGVLSLISFLLSLFAIYQKVF